MKEANACHDIRDMLFQKGYDIPICADMHFQPKVAIKTVRALTLTLTLTLALTLPLTLTRWGR